MRETTMYGNLRLNQGIVPNEPADSYLALRFKRIVDLIRFKDD
jgi:hypothetical protein